MRVFAGGISPMVQQGHNRPVYLLQPIPAMIEYHSSNKIRSLAPKGSGHAIRESYCGLGVSRGDCLFDICIQLGQPCAAWLLMRAELVATAAVSAC
jgi:hypothetical protein